MLDTFHIPRNTKADVQEFYANSPTAGSAWYTWKKPKGVSFVNFYVLGGGGAGGGGAAGGANAGAGGGGGGSSAQCNITFPAWALPDILYVSVGVGGIGSAGAGTAGIASYVTVFPAITPVNYILCQANGGAGAGAAAAGTGGTAGAGGAVTAITAAPLAGLGFVSRIAALTDISLAGQTGVAGSNTGIGTALALITTGLTVTCGTGGAGRQGNNAAGANGGTITGIGTPAGGVFPLQEGGLAGTVTTGGANGSNGFRLKPNFQFFYGGTGGGSGGANQVGPGQGGGNGGRGAFGSGGGGGGGCATGTTPGTGGYGGDGLVIATAW